MMVENGVFYVPTLVCALDELFMRQSGGFDQFHKGRVVVARFESTRFEESHPVGFRKALKAGVKIAFGGDSNPVGEFTLLEIEHMVRWGMTEMEALIAATRTSADLCGVVDELGTVEVGKLADLIVLSADPLAAVWGGIYAERVRPRAVEVGNQFVKLATEYDISPAQLAMLWVKDQEGISEFPQHLRLDEDANL